ncbi:pancreatic triacylglycerol lipase-like [Mercenaria mercenaria]|uniref:pancreatic triacylglycerol lipase-like n=1 Tax=Mercenaria mercenaria TaxID=6596 RepID=UPI00234EE75E|nr:pancreatic triacylglycerol lipase-like [Mercenaria mercenaria]
MQNACLYGCAAVLGLLSLRCVRCDSVTYNIGGEDVTFTNEPPTDNVERLPRKPDKIPTIFYLYTQGRKQKKQLAKIATKQSSTVKESTITGSNYDGTKRTIFICHGWWGLYLSDWVKKARKLILEEEDVNIIAVDYWKAAATSWDVWVQSVADSFLVGYVIAYFMKELNRITGASYGNMY